jgi:hypothetical protein
MDRATFWMAQLAKHGVEVMSTWPALIMRRHDGVANPRDASAVDRRLWARDCLNGIDACDVLWLLFPSTPTVGAFIEGGYAYATDKPIVASGDTKRSVFGALAHEFENDYDAFSFIVARNVKEQNRRTQPARQGPTLSIEDLADAAAGEFDTLSDSDSPLPHTEQNISSVITEFSQSHVARGRK